MMQSQMSQIIKLFCSAFIVTVLSATSVDADELQPLEQWLEQPSSRENVKYLYTRCAAIFLAFDKYGGQGVASAGDSLKVESERYSSRVMASNNGDTPANEITKMVEQYGEIIPRFLKTEPRQSSPYYSLLYGDIGLCMNEQARKMRFGF